LSEIFSPFKLALIFLQETWIILQFEAINGIPVYTSDDDKRLAGNYRFLYPVGVILFDKQLLRYVVSPLDEVCYLMWRKNS